MSQPPETGAPEGLPPAPPGYAYVPVAQVANGTRARPFELGTALSRGFAVWFSNLHRYVPIALLLSVPMAAYVLATGDVGGDDTLLGSLLWMVLTQLQHKPLTAAITFAVVRDAEGRRASVPQILGALFRRILPVLAITLLAVLLMMIGLVALLVGALVVHCVVYVAVPVALLEPGVGALDRSTELTRGFRWQIFVISLIGFVIELGLAFAAGAFLAIVAPDLSNDPAALAGVMIGVLSVSAALGASFTGVVYLGLRDEKDGAPVADLAQVFA